MRLVNVLVRHIGGFYGQYIALGLCFLVAVACSPSKDGLNATMTSRLPISGELVFTQ